MALYVLPLPFFPLWSYEVLIVVMCGAVIDSYFTASLILFSLQPDRTMEENMLLQRTQWLATVCLPSPLCCAMSSDVSMVWI